MRKLFFILTILLITSLTFGQGLFINGGYVIMKGGDASNGLHIVINRQANDGITCSSGGIINQDNNENNYVDWIIKNGASNSYTVPWTTTSQFIPFTYQITSPGTNDGRVLLSTWQTQSDNTTQVAGGITGRPAGVTNMNGLSGSDNSLYCTDRFWWVKYNNYVTKPSASLTFGYSDPTEIQAPNTITESDLQAQYWNGTAWVLPQVGSDIPASNYVNGATSVLSDVPWVLVSKLSPLPVALISFNASCKGGLVQLSWSTASETNNDYYTVERSSDAVNWDNIAQIDGSGNSNQVLNYFYTDEIYSEETTYYRLKQTDFDGTSADFDSVFVQCGENTNFEISVYPNPTHDFVYIEINNFYHPDAQIAIYDMLGKKIAFQNIISVEDAKIKTTFDLKSYADGMYFIQINADDFMKNYKIVKK